METTTFLAEIWQCLPTWLLAIFLLSGLLLPFVSDFKKWRDPDRVYRFLQILAGSWYIILCNLIFWVLLGGMQVGNDTLNYLVQKHNTAGNPLSPWDFWATAAAVQVSVMLFAAVAWITPQNNMSGDQLAIYSQNPARTVYRVLGLSTFYVLALSMIQFVDREEKGGLYCPAYFGLFCAVCLFLQLWVSRQTDLGRKPVTYVRNWCWIWLVASFLAWGLTAYAVLRTDSDFTGHLLYAIDFLFSGMVFWYATLWMDYAWQIPRDKVPALLKMSPHDTYGDAPRNAYYRLIYQGLGSLLAGVALWFAYLPNLQPIHPLVAILLGPAFFLMILDILHFAFMSRRLSRWFAAFWAVIAGFAWAGLAGTAWAETGWWVILGIGVFILLCWLLLRHFMAWWQPLSYDLLPYVGLFVLGILVSWTGTTLTQSIGNSFFILTGLGWLVLVTLQLSAYYRAQQKAHPKLKLSKVGNLLAGLNYAGKADLYEVPFIRRPLIFFKKPLENSLVRFYVLLISGFIVWQIGNGPAAAPATVTLGKEKRPAADLKTAISSWMKARNMSNDTSEYPVYIVSGQGGGSRAGYWMSHTLLGLDSLSQGQFRKHCFALSTISGSSPGAAVSLAYWVDTLPDKPGWQYFPQAVYENNFITCGVAGNFFGDFLRKFGFPRIKNRNQRLQEEEAWCVQRALHPDHSRVSLADAFGYRPIGMDSMQTLYQGFDRLYYPDDTLRTDLPYFFANTCHVQTGKRGVASVFRKGRDQDLFLLDAIPITELMDTTITLGGAANISELFPFVSAAGGIDYQHPKPKVDPQAPDDWAPETALFVDGGYYENYGLTTALELSRMFKVVKQENPKAFSRFKIHIICVVNSDAHIGESDLPHQTVSHSVNQFQAPVTALLNTPFSGHASQLRWQMKYVFHPDSLFDYSEIVLPNSVNVPLSRILTQANIKKMDDAWEKDVTVNKISISLHKK